MVLEFTENTSNWINRQGVIIQNLNKDCFNSPFFQKALELYHYAVDKGLNSAPRRLAELNRELAKHVDTHVSHREMSFSVG